MDISPYAIYESNTRLMNYHNKEEEMAYIIRCQLWNLNNLELQNVIQSREISIWDQVWKQHIHL